MPGPEREAWNRRDEKPKKGRDAAAQWGKGGRAVKTIPWKGEQWDPELSGKEKPKVPREKLLESWQFISIFRLEVTQVWGRILETRSEVGKQVAGNTSQKNEHGLKPTFIWETKGSKWAQRVTELPVVAEKGRGRDLPAEDGHLLLFYERKGYAKRKVLHGIGRGGQRWGIGGVDRSEVEQRVKQ